jgi:uncharacterized caspase-like protein
LLQAGLGATAMFQPAPYAWVWAQSEGTLKLLRAPKYALVIGNSNYKHSPLKNPANDARAISETLKRTGFDVAIRLDAVQAELSEAVQSFTQALAKSKGIGLFYFAGHGLQLAWRNYMIPVDADIRSATDIQKQGVEVGTLLSGITKAVNPLNVIILDACRDNPFGSLGGVDQKGLSQMDAPPSTLLAYATAPGNVASDGDGANGLYTEHLLREIAVPDAKVEDVFKRVRLHVRRRTNGLQIPWESTSLEEDFYFVPPKTLSTLADAEAERERKLEEAAHAKRRAEGEAERKRKQEEALLEARRAAEEAERKRQEELAALERQRIAEEAERKRKQELALKEAQRVTEEAERKRREEQALRDAKAAEEEAARKYKQELALRENQRAEQEAERKRKEAQVLREAKLAEEEAARKYKQETVLREKQRVAASAPTGKPDANRAERQYAEESAIWEKIKASTEPGPLEEYLLRFPSGSFSELAQFQLDRVLAHKGEKKVEAVSSAANPFTKGTVRTDTNYKVGDIFRYREIDMLTKLELRTFALRVTAITDNQVLFNNGNFVTDLLGNLAKNARGQFSGSQFLIPEYSVGKRWSARSQRTVGNWPARDISHDFKVVAKEQVVVPAGAFEAFKIEATGWTQTNDGMSSIQLQARYWMAPGVRRAIAFENLNRHARGHILASERQELVAYTQG